MSSRDYWCFISYAHVDNKQEGRQWAAWLHQSLETYEVPDDLVGRLNERGERIPERIFPVFRDEDELATGDLKRRIYEALDRTRVLVVLCSPRARLSSYVDQEIRYFKGLQDGNVNAIHAAIVDGDPSAAGNQQELCFPESLRYEVRAGALVTDKPVVPLAADFRLADGMQGWTTPEAYRRALEDGEESRPREEIDKLVADYGLKLKISLLRLVSGILGVPYGTLQQRDKAYQLKLAQARARTLRNWLVAVSALLAGIIGIGAYSYLQSVWMSRADRVATARQTVDLARAVNDEDPIAAVKHGLHALTILEVDDPESVSDAYAEVADVLRYGRWARIGNMVDGVYPTMDGVSIVVVHNGGVAELLRVSDLRPERSWYAASSLSESWGPTRSG